MRLRLLGPILLAAALLAIPVSAVETTCFTPPGATACVLLPQPGLTSAGVFVVTDSGLQVEFIPTAGDEFHGPFVFAVALVGLEGVFRVHGGVGFTDPNRDGLFENGCVCGGVQTTFLSVPWGVGYEDLDGDGQPDNVYVLPQL